ncbi:hypothetical protein GCM10010389_16190 [Streptomyces echinoruber]|uniref:Uncharacterized protein n=1 Tax=Streptomyces echinoruber TaxID=68898 RepID=A0A918QZ20_9ACTN|nr:hypothetical protein GCM10010389_16190 [Streptomyces echinoruber]
MCAWPPFRPGQGAPPRRRTAFRLCAGARPPAGTPPIGFGHAGACGFARPGGAASPGGGLIPYSPDAGAPAATQHGIRRVSSGCHLHRAKQEEDIE